MQTNTEKSRKRRAKAKKAGAERINIELRGPDAAQFRKLKERYDGATAAITYLIGLSTARKDMTPQEALAVLAQKAK